MLTTPKLEQRSALPYVSIRRTVDMDKIADELPPLIPTILSWVEKKNIPQNGPAFFRYMCWTENHQLEVEVGVPVQKPVEGEGEIQPGSFPAGTYLLATFFGHFKGLSKAHMDLEDWAEKNNIKTKDQSTPVGQSYGGRTEFYPMDPDDEPDPDKWRTDLAFPGGVNLKPYANQEFIAVYVFGLAICVCRFYTILKTTRSSI